MRRLALIAFLATAPSVVAAQTTQDLLDKGIKAYVAFDVEQARPLFEQIISPSNINQVSPLQRVTAYKYLGASYAVLAKPDSAERFFIAALDFDPFTDLDPTLFAGSELNAFNIAKTKIFRAGMDPLKSRVVNPRADSTFYQFRIVTTHRASVTLELVSQDQKIEKSIQQLESRRKFLESQLINSDSDTIEARNHMRGELDGIKYAILTIQKST